MTFAVCDLTGDSISYCDGRKIMCRNQRSQLDCHCNLSVVLLLDLALFSSVIMPWPDVSSGLSHNCLMCGSASA